MCVGYQHEREPSVVTDAKKSIKIDKKSRVSHCSSWEHPTSSWQQLNELAAKIIIKQQKMNCSIEGVMNWQGQGPFSIYVFIFYFIFLYTTVTGCPWWMWPSWQTILKWSNYSSNMEPGREWSVSLCPNVSFIGNLFFVLLTGNHFGWNQMAVRNRWICIWSNCSTKPRNSWKRRVSRRPVRFEWIWTNKSPSGNGGCAFCAKWSRDSNSWVSSHI